MNDLDDLDKTKKIDSRDMAGSIVYLKDQVKSAWSESRALKLPDEYRKVKNICLIGMGGSALGAHIIRSVYDIPVPFQIVQEYTLPAFVNENTLVITSSYSGTTEEVNSSLKDAIRKKAKIVGITSGAALADDLKQNSLPCYQFDEKFNPSNNPRLGLGYTLVGILGMLSNLGLVEVADKNIQKITARVDELNATFSPESKQSDNEAKQQAEELLGKIFTIVAGPFLAGNAHTFANQINEGAKAFGSYFLLSELNHHLLEGITHPEALRRIVKFFNFESDLYEEKIKIRMKVGNELLDRFNIPYTSYKIKSSEKDVAAFEALAFSSWTSFYMAIAYGVDPSVIPNVDYFKKQLTQRS
jgi:glucose/mannose-6-phosphate isomerase